MERRRLQWFTTQSKLVLLGVCQTHHFVHEGMAEVGAVGGEQQRQTVDELRLGEAEDNWRRERERERVDRASRWMPV